MVFLYIKIVFLYMKMVSCHKGIYIFLEDVSKKDVIASQLSRRGNLISDAIILYKSDCRVGRPPRNDSL